MNYSEVQVPVVSAVMLVYNGEKHLQEAIESVLNQTFSNFEFIIINDGSTDSSLQIIEAYKDERIRVINNQVNLGIPRSRNIGLQEARGKFVAWCDCDDVNFSNRFEEQVKFLQTNAQYIACGSWQLYSNGRKYLVNKTMSSPAMIKALLLFKPAVMNPTSMFRLSMLREHKLLYKNDLAIAEDHDLFLRCSMLFDISNVQKILVKYRASETSIIKKFKSKEEESDQIHNAVYTEALNYLGMCPSETDLKYHSLCCSEKPFRNFNEYKASHEWLTKLQKKNVESRVFDSNALNKILANRFYVISKKAAPFGLITFGFFVKKCRTSFGNIKAKWLLKLAVMSVTK